MSQPLVPLSDTIPVSDACLLAQTAEDNQLALGILFERYHQPLYRYALRFTKSAALAEDVVQDTFVKLWEKRSSLPEVRECRAFLFAICRNHLLTLLNRATREKGILEEIIQSMPLMHTSSEETAVIDQYSKIAESAIAHLPPQRQQVFRLCRLQGLTYEETAQQLHISPSTVSDHLVKATKSLREYLSVHADLSLLVLILPQFFVE